jgi:HEPN domain-containing protein
MRGGFSVPPGEYQSGHYAEFINSRNAVRVQIEKVDDQQSIVLGSVVEIKSADDVLKDWLWDLIRELDEQQASEGISPKKRQDKAIRLLEGNPIWDTWLTASGQSTSSPFGIPNNFVHQAVFVEEWYSTHYADQGVNYLKSVGRVPFLFRGSVGAVFIPLRFGNPEIPQVRLEGVTSALVKLFSNEDKKRLKSDLDWGIRCFEAVRNLGMFRMDHDIIGAELFDVAVQNVNEGVNSLLGGNNKNAAFCAQQSVEISLKAFLQNRGVNYRKIHDLDRLLDDAKQIDGQLDGLRPYVRRSSFDMGIRYEIPVPLEEAVSAVRASIHVMGNMAGGLVGTPKRQ